MLRKLFIIGASLTLLSAAQIGSAEESAAFVARTVALQQQSSAASDAQSLANRASQRKADSSTGG